MRAAWLGALSAAWMAASWPAHRNFRKLLGEPEVAQRRALERVLEGARGAAYGQKYGVAKVRTLSEWQDAVPLVTYDELSPWIERVCAGERDVLTTRPVLMVEPTGGSSAAAKYIPYTAALRDEFNRALSPWMFDLYTTRPRLLPCATYWSVSPAGRAATRTPGGVPIGFEDDTEYFGGLERFVMSRLMPVPGSLSRLPDLDAVRAATLVRLLAEPRLGLISVWSPTFLTLLLAFLYQKARALVNEVPGARGRELSALLSRHGELPLAQVWPHLSVVSCWASASAATFIPEMRRLLPGVEVQPKGLLATEGVVTIPLWDQPAPVLAVDSHLFEFLPESGPPRAAHELEVGARYSVVLSTSGGLYRYRLKDEVRVVSHLARTPLLEFLGREPGTTDLCGEKLAEEHVARALSLALEEAGVRARFALVAPWMEAPPRYVLHVESDAPPEALRRAADSLERALSENPHYAYARRLGQLESVRAFRIAEGGAAAHLEACTRRGQRAGNVKPAVLERAGGWEAAFRGEVA